MKAIIYHSLSNNTKTEVTNRFEGDFYRLVGKIKIPKRYVFQLMYLGMFATFKADLKYEQLDIDFDKYDEIVLASPVWAFTITPFMKKFLKDNRFRNKKVTLLLTNLGGPRKAMKRFKKYLDSSNVIVEEILIQNGDQYKAASLIKKK